MPKRQKSAVRKYHDRVARRYDDIYDDAYWQFHDTLTWDYIKPHLPRDLAAPVLDLGCGTGKWALKLLQSGYRVTCVDISGAMVEQARKSIADAGKVDRADFLRADLCDLSALPENQFAFAVAMGEPIGCCSAPGLALKQIRKRLTPEGVLIATLDNRLAALDYYAQRGNARETAAFLKTGRTHWLTKDREEQFEIHTFTPHQAAKLFTQAGFEVLQALGKIVLPIRRYRELLADPEQRRHWLKIEKTLGKDPDAIATAGHLQITARLQR
jgi:ubiquinone/menaquinone biosynthesis C-methylase UbiE